MQVRDPFHKCLCGTKIHAMRKYCIKNCGEPGEELDKLVATKVMGWKDGDHLAIKSWVSDEGCAYPKHMYLFSMDILAAWQVINKLDRLWFEVGRESACGVRYDVVVYGKPDKSDKVHTMADTAPHAICMAALKAVGHDVG